ncbi:MAG: ABC transporter ATP-binding protein [Pseudanabaena sp. ELA607]
MHLNAISYGSILRSISCPLPAGECIAIVGATGSGKSTLLRLLNRLIDVTEGEITHNEKPIKQIPVNELRRRIVLVPQESRLLDMTVLDALLYPLRLQKLAPEIANQRLDHWLTVLDFERHLLSRTALELSLGQRQWVAICRGLMMEPEVLLLDEPTSALDYGIARHLCNVLRQYVIDHPQRTVIMTNHQLELIQNWCDRLIHLHRGQLAQVYAPPVGSDWESVANFLVESAHQEAAEWE